MGKKKFNKNAPAAKDDPNVQQQQQQQQQPSTSQQPQTVSADGAKGDKRQPQRGPKMEKQLGELSMQDPQPPRSGEGDYRRQRQPTQEQRRGDRDGTAPQFRGPQQISGQQQFQEDFFRDQRGSAPHQQTPRTRFPGPAGFGQPRQMPPPPFGLQPQIPPLMGTQATPAFGQRPQMPPQMQPRIQMGTQAAPNWGQRPQMPPPLMQPQTAPQARTSLGQQQPQIPVSKQSEQEGFSKKGKKQGKGPQEPPRSQQKSMQPQPAQITEQQSIAKKESKVVETPHKQKPQQPPDTEKQPPADTPSQQKTKKAPQRKQRQEASPTDFIVPLRKQLSSGGTKGRRILIETNHLALILKHLKPAIHYDVAIEPDKPKKFLRLVMEQFRKEYYPQRYPAFDGVKNLYSSSHLPFGHEISGDVTIAVDDRDKVYNVKIKYAAEVDLQCLAEYFGSTARANIHMVTPQEAIQCLDIVLRNAPALNCIPVGRSFFTRPGNMVDLGEGMEMYNGVYQSAVLGWKPFLNVDVAHKAFPKTMHVLDVIQELCYNYRLTEPLVHYNYETVNHFMKTLKVLYQIPNQPNSRRVMRVNQLDRPARDARFKNEQNVEMSVSDYFSRVKQVALRYPHLPCLWVGSRQREPKILIPLEFCTILEGQVTNRAMTANQTSAMIKSAATSTDVRKGKIMDNVRKANYNADPCVKEFGISVNQDFTKVQARVLDPPTIKYQKRAAMVQKGVWRADSFCTSNELSKWAIVGLDVRTRPEALHEFGKMMAQQGRPLGMSISQPEVFPVNLPRNREKEIIEKEFNKLKNHQLILVVIPDIKDIYNYVKQTAELKVGVITQCVKGKNVFRPKPSTVGNILLKVNAKLNGLNHTLGHTPLCLQVPCMIMGADVTHPSPDQRGSVPSVAAVTASHDRNAFKYNITCRLQQSTQEIITDLANIVREHLMYFEKINKRKPDRIIFFRDGVSEGQFEIVVNSEVQAVRRGCAMLDPSGNYKPKLTFLVVQKRHHTRFFPTNPRDSEDRNCNVPAGTVVDTEITHPTALDFYLVSHASIQGVARPTKYRKLWDDNDMQEDELEELTYHLCHLFARCTRSVSYPAPTYYAHLAAARAKVYCENQRIDMNNLERAQGLLAIKTEIVKDAPMYFV